MTIAPPVLLSEEQNLVIDFVQSHLYEPVIAIYGPAGSGKTSLIKVLRESIPGLVTVSATTNKAAYVLRRKDIPSVTMHQACLRPRFKAPYNKISRYLEQQDIGKYPDELLEEFEANALMKAYETAQKLGIYAGMRELGIVDAMSYIDGWSPADHQEGTLVVDEASMLDQIGLDIVQTVYDRVILVGDEFQLPPVKGSPAFWKVACRTGLTQIHRQAENSQPLRLATEIRTGEKISIGPVGPISAKACFGGAPVIVWTNATRLNLTKKIRNRLGFTSSLPVAGERLICRNTADKHEKNRGFINNSLWEVVSISGSHCQLRDEDGHILSTGIHMEETDTGYGIPFRFAYALTCHSSQGSEWDSVMIHERDTKLCFENNRVFGRRFLYTAATRARTKVTWVNDVVAA